MLYPLVMALVMLPAASRTSADSVTSWLRPAISAIPLALSTMGPKASLAMMMPFISVMPKVAAAIPKKPAIPPPMM